MEVLAYRFPENTTAEVVQSPEPPLLEIQPEIGVKGVPSEVTEIEVEVVPEEEVCETMEVVRPMNLDAEVQDEPIVIMDEVPCRKDSISEITVCNFL
ncbi:hypothetical protein Nepgr_013668 [Nepenthes gracilis]|uniref:Uncharacterized protein n=1 Tax=Nepenthes gracilis TaxID=150966 RepID=A0AAD3SIS8_NEPGR|nr:hypothetical protein Nepgr_013668 [Nepenthes gracilis]